MATISAGDLDIRFQAQTQQLNKSIAETERRIRRMMAAINRSNRKGKKGTDELSKGLMGVAKSAGLAAAGYMGLRAAIAGLDTAKQAAYFKDSKVVFEQLGFSLEQFREQTKGLIDDQTLVQKANLAQQMGITGREFQELANIADAAAKKTGQSQLHMFNSMVVGAARSSRLILDNAGIMVDWGKAHDVYAKANGKTVKQLTQAEKKQSELNQVLMKGREIIKDVADGGADSGDAFDRFEAMTQNLKLALGDTLLPSINFVITGLTNMSKHILSVKKDFGGFIDSITENSDTLMFWVNALGVGGPRDTQDAGQIDQSVALVLQEKKVELEEELLAITRFQTKEQIASSGNAERVLEIEAKILRIKKAQEEALKKAAAFTKKQQDALDKRKISGDEESDALEKQAAKKRESFLDTLRALKQENALRAQSTEMQKESLGLIQDFGNDLKSLQDKGKDTGIGFIETFRTSVKGRIKEFIEEEFATLDSASLDILAKGAAKLGVSPGFVQSTFAAQTPLTGGLDVDPYTQYLSDLKKSFGDEDQIRRDKVISDIEHNQEIARIQGEETRLQSTFEGITSDAIGKVFDLDDKTVRELRSAMFDGRTVEFIGEKLGSAVGGLIGDGLDGIAKKMDSGKGKDILSGIGGLAASLGGSLGGIAGAAVGPIIGVVTSFVGKVFDMAVQGISTVISTVTGLAALDSKVSGSAQKGVGAGVGVFLGLSLAIHALTLGFGALLAPLLIAPALMLGVFTAFSDLAMASDEYKRLQEAQSNATRPLIDMLGKQLIEPLNAFAWIVNQVSIALADFLEPFFDSSNTVQFLFDGIRSVLSMTINLAIVTVDTFNILNSAITNVVSAFGALQIMSALMNVAIGQFLFGIGAVSQEALVGIIANSTTAIAQGTANLNFAADLVNTDALYALLQTLGFQVNAADAANDAMNDLTGTIKELNAEYKNVPTGFKADAAEWAAINAGLSSGLSISTASAAGVTTAGGAGGGSSGHPSVNIGVAYIETAKTVDQALSDRAVVQQLGTKGATTSKPRKLPGKF